MGIDLGGRCVLVTGGTQGLGAEIAREAARRGAARLVLTGRDARRGAEMARELAAAGTEARFLAADLADADAAAELVPRAEADMGPLDGLVNAAGRTDRASLAQGTAEDWEALFALNARAPFLLMQGFVRSCLARGRPGAVVNVLSMNAHCGAPDLAIYSATKGALATLTKNAAHAHLADRIRVNGIMMGWSPTDAERRMQAETLGQGEGWLAAAAAEAPLGRLLEPAEVARLTCYLLSDYSGLQTGTLVDLEQRVLGAP